MSVVIQFFKDLSPVKLAMAVASVFLFLIFFAFFVYKFSFKSMVLLYSDLDLSDSNRIVQELENQRVSYELISGGTGIKVPEDQVLRLRVSMAQEGLPGKGSLVGYEIFDKEESLGSTSFLQNVKMLRALEGELIRTIESLDAVLKARVHLVIPKKELFSKERQDPRASVVLKMKGNRKLSKQQVDSVSNLVASSVPELELSNITIIDTNGKSLKLALQEDDMGYSAASNDERKIAAESKLKRTIEDLLERTLGHGKVIAQVNLDMNFDREVTNSEIFDPDSAVVRSEQNIEERERSPAGGEDGMDASVANNIPGGGLEDGASGNFSTIERIDDTHNYEISKTVTSKIKDSGAIEKLSVAVLVDGVYKKDENGVNQYQSREESELEKIENIVKVAVGYNEDREDQVKVINMPFVNDVSEMDEEDLSDWFREELPNIVQTIVIAAVTLLVFVVVIRPIAMRAFDMRNSESDLEQELQGNLTKTQKDAAEEEAQDVMLNISKSMPKPATSNNTKKINDSAEQYPQETLMLLRKWLNEDS